MKTAEVRWGPEHSELFSETAGKVRGYIRYEVTRQNLGDNLAEFLSSPKRIIDIGGGEGGDAAWLSNMEAGHDVTLVEPNSRSLGKAVARKSRISSFIIGDLKRAAEIYDDSSFDLVLSHGVIQYSDEPQSDINTLSRLMSPHGRLSLLTAGKFGKLEYYKDEPDKIRRLLLDGKYLNYLGAQTTAYLPQEIESMLTRAQLEVEAWFGVRIDTSGDDRKVKDVPALELNRVFNAELSNSRDPAKRSSGQMLHFIARKILN